MNKIEWGTKEWFEQQFDQNINPEIDGWKISWRASQLFRFKLYNELIKPIINGKKNLYLLEIGCASGDYTNYIYKMNPFNTIFAIDISRNAILRCQRKFPPNKYPNISFKTEVLPNLIFDDNFFDGIFCLEVLYYLNYQDQISSLMNIEKKLKNNGFLLLSGVINRDLKYFDEMKILSMISKFFIIEKVIYNYSKIYNYFERKILLILDLIFFLEKLNYMPSEELQKYLNNLKSRKRLLYIIINIYLFSFLKFILLKILNFVKFIIKKILLLELPVRICYHLTKILFGERGKTQIIILARKKKLDSNND